MTFTSEQLLKLGKIYTLDELNFIQTTLQFYDYELDKKDIENIVKYLSEKTVRVVKNILICQTILKEQKWDDKKWLGNVHLAFFNAVCLPAIYYLDRDFSVTDFLHEDNYDDEMCDYSTHLSRCKEKTIQESTQLVPVSSPTNNNNKDTSKQNYEFVNHPSHYNEWSYEVVDMMEKIYGTELTAWWCEITAFKYATRMGFKPTDDVMQDLDKRNWYLNKAKELRNKIK